jgi:hypothetical protein
MLVTIGPQESPRVEIRNGHREITFRAHFDYARYVGNRGRDLIGEQGLTIGGNDAEIVDSGQAVPVDADIPTICTAAPRVMAWPNTIDPASEVLK